MHPKALRAHKTIVYQAAIQLANGQFFNVNH